MANYRPGGDRFGRHRVLEPKGALPQAASKLDNSLPIYENELLIDVSTLNIDSASFRQMRDACKGDYEGIASQVMDNVQNMGKQQNPVTGSGGMLLGKIADIGPQYSNRLGLSVGDNVCTLVSLTLTPLIVEKIKKVHEGEQIDVEGKAVLFDSGVLAKVPDDIDLKVALALMDVAGAAPQAERLASKGDTVLVIGSGKSAVLCAAALRQKYGKEVTIIGTSSRMKNVEAFKATGLIDQAIQANALNPSELMDKVAEATNDKMCDLVINTANIEGTELASILTCRQGGRVYFFNMATNFQKAALGAEGVGRDVDMIIGNGYAPNHADITLNIYRENPTVKKWFDERFG
jgi:L-erythro-3,5-diaminohexanoate dehydrogenase